MILMRQTKLLLQCAVIWFGLISLSAMADNADQPDQRDAQGWLKKIQSAAQKLNYSGTFLYQQGNLTRTSRITHVLDGKNELEKFEVLEGKPREYIRKNEEISSYIPETHTILVGKRYAPDFFPAMLAANVNDLSEHYDIKKGELCHIGGYDCQTINLEPKDDLRYGYRLSAERNSGLLLRAQTLNEHHEVLEQITFAQVTIGGIDKNSVKPGFANTAGWRVENSEATQEAISGWSVTAMPAGFKKIHELKHMVPNGASPATTNVPASTPLSQQHEVSQLVFSDGLAAISVFIEPGSQGKTEGSMQQGAMNIIAMHQRDFWVTIVGEAPVAAIRQVSNSIEFKSR